MTALHAERRLYRWLHRRPGLRASIGRKLRLLHRAARTVVTDVEPIADVERTLGMAIESATLIGSSPIRRHSSR